MEKESMLKTALLGVLMLLFPMGYSFPMRVPTQPVAPRPLCASQIALVNRACALLPYSRAPPDSPPGQSLEPPGPPPPSTPPSTDHSPEDEYRHEGHDRHGRGHERHRHRHRSVTHHVKTTIEAECCRWLAQVDDECVCDMLVHLPRFLARPVHQYTVIVADACSITFDCASALIP